MMGSAVDRDKMCSTACCTTSFTYCNCPTYKSVRAQSYLVWGLSLLLERRRPVRSNIYGG